MGLGFSSNKNKPWINYLLIMLAFAVLLFGIYLYFKYKLKTIEKESITAYEAKRKVSRYKHVFSVVKIKPFLPEKTNQKTSHFHFKDQ